MCERVEEWPWSSHGATIGSRPPGFLAIDLLLSHFGETRAQARARYLALLEAEEDPPAPSHPLLDGDAAFVSSHLEGIEQCAEHPRVTVSPPRPPLRDLVADSGDSSAIARAHLEHGYSMRQIATQLGCGLTTIHRRIRSYESERALR